MLALATGLALAQDVPLVGRALVDVIAALRNQGFSIIYSNELLPPRLRVDAEPQAPDPIGQLDEALRAHGLRLEPGPRDSWLVVRLAATERQPDATVAAPGPVLVPPTLETIVVTASRYLSERPTATSATTVGRRVLDNSPALGQDPLRITRNLPGVSGNELSAQSHIRGGELDEALIRLDGIRLFSPYHLKDFQNVFSSINSRIIESMDIRTGGYEAQFGDRMSGVIDMATITPTEARHFELGLSLLDTSVLSSGVFARGRGAWLTSLRRGNLDVLADVADSDAGSPQYVDFFNKLNYALTPRLELTGGILSLDDKITLEDGDEATAAADYDDAYLWVRLDHSGRTGLESTVRIVSTTLQRTRNGSIDDADRATGTLADSSRFDRLDLNADFRLPLSTRGQLSFGLELADLDLDRAFRSERSMLLPIVVADLAGPASPPANVRVQLSQIKRAVYLSYRLRFLPQAVAEIGVRADNQSLTDEDQLSPRLNLLFELSDRTSFRAAWGHYSQSHSPTELAVSDGSTSLLPAEQSQHLVLGLEHVLTGTTTLRAEVYSKRVSRLNHRFENVFERVSLIPELLPDRYRITPLSATIQGIELSIEGSASDRLAWWANFTRARAEERLPGSNIDRSWDEQWALKAGGEWLRGAWTIAASAALRSGWPITALGLSQDQLVAGAFNAERLPGFASVNLRVDRQIVTARGRLDWYLEVNNLLDRSDYCCLDYQYLPAAAGEPATLVVERADLLGIVPNLGLRWQF